MILRSSCYLHQISLDADRVLIVHAISHLRVTVDATIGRIVDFFTTPRPVPAAYAELSELSGFDDKGLSRLIKTLIESGILTEKSPAGELAEIAGKLGATHGRDPVALLDRYRRTLTEGSNPAWAATTTRTVDDLAAPRKRLDVIVFGDCEMQMEADFLRQEAARRGIDLRAAASFVNDLELVGERPHDAIIIGALQARHLLPLDPDSKQAHAAYIGQARQILSKLRQLTAAPILIDNLPEPTVQPLGLAERGLAGHRTRFRTTNVVLTDLVESFTDVHVVDIAAALAGAGAMRLLDDGQVGFTHFGSPGWLLQRPESEKQSVHGIFPDPSSLARLVGADPYAREAVTARAHADALMVALGTDRKKCVVVDLDGVLWPGVLAETGSPFAWDPANSGVFSYIGLFVGIHEALLCLKKRGVVLACVSKNDEATVRELWKYSDHYPRERLLTPADFVTWRVNWNDKVENIRSIACELGFALETFLFIDDHPVERDRVRQRLPEIEVWGDDLFALRRALLEDPRLQLPRITAEAASRTSLVKAQLGRQQLRAEVVSETDYVASLGIECRIERVTTGERLPRIVELFQRTTQFNTTGRKFTVAGLQALVKLPGARLFALDVRDRFGDHGLVGAAVIEEAEISGLVLSCRVMGCGVEHAFLQQIKGACADLCLTARIVETPRNIPVRNIYRDNGFIQRGDGSWRVALPAEAA